MSEFVSPVARIVWGHPRTSRPVIDDRTKQPKLRADGSARRAIEFGIAIPKAEVAELYAAMQAAAAEKFPQGVPANFAWKVKDGDTDVDGKGRPLREKEGYAGCIVLTCRTELDSVPNYTFDHATNKWIATDAIKRGDFVRVTLDFSARVATSHTEKSSLYVNPRAVMLWQVGAEIKGGEYDPNAADFAPPPPMTPPPGAPLPGGPAPGLPGTSAGPSPNQPPAAPPLPGSLPGGQPPVNPHTAFLNGPGGKLPGQ